MPSDRTGGWPYSSNLFVIASRGCDFLFPGCRPHCRPDPALLRAAPIWRPGNMMAAAPQGGRVSVVTNTPTGPGVRQRGPAGTGLQPGWGVSPERQHAIAEVLVGLVPLAGRLAPVQLRAAWRHAPACGRISSSGTPMCAGTCPCTGPTPAMCGCWPGNVAKTPTGMTTAGRLGRSPWPRAAWSSSTGPQAADGSRAGGCSLPRRWRSGPRMSTTSRMAVAGRRRASMRTRRR